eukprot:TRINITY_DN10748_c0_g1_i1.p1 TRINITY_DN10748_c0_g1~~TRINITY_DN10748_c0_g1_i1.p1  ORF type:complete len:257 (-),score=56.61 TRINITY_DN10748_c0_g1_i1:36-755(-)
MWTRTLLSNSKITTRHYSTKSQKKTKIDFYYDVVSPYSFLAHQILKRYQEAGYDLDIQMKPVLLGGIFNSIKNNAPVDVLAKKVHLRVDVNRASKFYDVPFSVPGVFPVRTLMHMRILTVLKEIQPEKVQLLSEIFWHYLFVEHADMNSEETLTVCFREADISDDIISAISEKIQEPKYKQALMTATDEAIERGAFGVPTFFVKQEDGEDEMYFGSDRLEYMMNDVGIPWQRGNPKKLE